MLGKNVSLPFSTIRGLQLDDFGNRFKFILVTTLARETVVTAGTQGFQVLLQCRITITFC